MREIARVERNCDLCGNGGLDEILAYTTTVRTRSDAYLWSVRNVVCRNCGFAFVSPAPTQDALTEYYSDCFEYWRGEAHDYSIENRLSLLRRHIAPGSHPSFVEVGGNSTDPFRQAISGIVQAYRSVELNRGCDSDFQSLESIPENSIDIVAAYFVLEHVPDPREFLSLCASRLSERGFLILEVPNLYIYAINAAGIMWWEHTNHFSPRTLAALAGSLGLHLVEVSSRYCSRPFGFAAVFSRSKGAAAPRMHSDLTEYLIAKACMTEGALGIRAYQDQLTAVRYRITAAATGELPVVVWAANKTCLDLLDGFRPPPRTAVFVDSDPNKKTYLDPLPVHLPQDARDSILSAKLFVINSSLHAEEIRGQITRLGRNLGDDEVVIVDPGFDIYRINSGAIT